MAWHLAIKTVSLYGKAIHSPEVDGGSSADMLYFVHVNVAELSSCATPVVVVGEAELPGQIGSMVDSGGWWMVGQ